MRLILAPETSQTDATIVHLPTFRKALTALPTCRATNHDSQRTDLKSWLSNHRHTLVTSIATLRWTAQKRSHKRTAPTSVTNLYHALTRDAMSNLTQNRPYFAVEGSRWSMPLRKAN